MFVCCWLVHLSLHKDEEDQAYLTDELGNIELAQSSVPRTDSTESSSAPQAEDWGEWPDDPAYLEALQEVERATEEVPDELLLQAVTECEWWPCNLKGSGWCHY